MTAVTQMLRMMLTSFGNSATIRDKEDDRIVFGEKMKNVGRKDFVSERVASQKRFELTRMKESAPTSCQTPGFL